MSASPSDPLAMRRDDAIMSSPTPSHAAYVSTRAETSGGIGTSSISASSITCTIRVRNAVRGGGADSRTPRGRWNHSVTSTRSRSSTRVRVHHRALDRGQAAGRRGCADDARNGELDLGGATAARSSSSSGEAAEQE